jgi:hypothetical protein
MIWKYGVLGYNQPIPGTAIPRLSKNKESHDTKHASPLNQIVVSLTGADQHYFAGSVWICVNTGLQMIIGLFFCLYGDNSWFPY